MASRVTYTCHSAVWQVKSPPRGASPQPRLAPYRVRMATAWAFSASLGAERSISQASAPGRNSSSLTVSSSPAASSYTRKSPVCAAAPGSRPSKNPWGPWLSAGAGERVSPWAGAASPLSCPSSSTPGGTRSSTR